MVIAEGLGTLCILLGISGLRDNDGFSLDAISAGYMPLFVGVCLPLLFMGWPLLSVVAVQVGLSDGYHST